MMGKIMRKSTGMGSSSICSTRSTRHRGRMTTMTTIRRTMRRRQTTMIGSKGVSLSDQAVTITSTHHASPATHRHPPPTTATCPLPLPHHHHHPLPHNSTQTTGTHHLATPPRTPTTPTTRHPHLSPVAHQARYTSHQPRTRYTAQLRPLPRAKSRREQAGKGQGFGGPSKDERERARTGRYARIYAISCFALRAGQKALAREWRLLSIE